MNEVLACPRCLSAKRSEDNHQAMFYHDGLERLQAAARKRGGECLSSEYTGARKRYRFRCAARHEWRAFAGTIWQGGWCSRCASIANRTSIETLQMMAAERGGKCLSTEALGTQVKHTWECHRGHVWQTTPATIRSGSWCPNCAWLKFSTKPSTRKRWDVEG
ncbi:hypothetical protein [Caballeronia catudaia]|nr:hypothetical protein [Caballeronia catudaia]